MCWKAIIREAQRYHEQAIKTGFKLKTICIRTPELKAFGTSTQTEITAAEKAGILSIVSLTSMETAQFYAANELFAAASQQNIGYTVDQTLAFLSEKLGHWVDRFAKATITVPKVIVIPSTKLPDAIVKIVSGIGLIPWNVLQKRLVKENFHATREEVLLECGKLGNQIAVFSSPTNSVFRWIK
jgi:hypothetical protein